MFTIPTVVTTNDLNKRSYISFYYNNERVREYSGKKLGLNLYPNNAHSLKEREALLDELKFEFRKALEAGYSPNSKPEIKVLIKTEEIIPGPLPTTEALLRQALTQKLNSDLSKSYKKDLVCVHDQFKAFSTLPELSGPITSITTFRIEEFLSRFGSTGTYYMNKRRNLGVLFSTASRLIDQPLRSVKNTPRRKAKAKLHDKYEKEQLKPIFKFLRDNLEIPLKLTTPFRFKLTTRSGFKLTTLFRSKLTTPYFEIQAVGTACHTSCC